MDAYKSGRLGSYVHVPDDNGRMHVFGPSGEVPEWAARRITNAKAWATPPTFPVEEEADLVGDGSGQDAGAGTGDALVRPPTSGKGSGAEAWRDYATARGIAVDDDADRAAIIAAVDAADAEAPATGTEGGGEE